MTATVRVLVADDSAFSRVTLSKIIERDPLFEVIGTAVNGEEAIRLTVERQPDILTLDLEMPGMNGFAVLRWLRANRPTRTVVVSSHGGQEGVFRALELGAVDFVVKPTVHASKEYARLEDVLLEKLRAVAQARMRPLGPMPATAEPERRAPAVTPPAATGAADVLLIGASTGGPAAISSIFADLPPLPLPIVVAQHMPEGFTRPFAERLSRVCRFSVHEARDGEKLRAGRAYLGPGGRHVEVAGESAGIRLRVVRRGTEDFYSPSVDRLFESAARVPGLRIVAAVLTGMGSDGRDGLLAVRAAGGRTLAESQETAVVYGMPREAAESGAAGEILPLSQIASALVRLTTESFRLE